MKTPAKEWARAIKRDDVSALRVLTARGRAPLVAPGGTPLLHLARSVPMVDALLLAGVDPSATDHNGRTALHTAAARLNEPVVYRLLEEGLYAGVRSTKGRTVLHEASRVPRTRPGHALNIVRRLIKSGCPVDATDHRGRTAAHYAAKQGRSRVLALLYDAVARFDIADSAGQTAEQIVKKTPRALVVRWELGRARMASSSDKKRHAEPIFNHFPSSGPI